MLVVGFLLLAAAALLFACWPLLRRHESGAESPGDDAATAVYRRRLEEIGGEIEDQQLLDELRGELGAVLLSEAGADDETNKNNSDQRQPERRWFVLMLLVPIVASILYVTVADPGVLQVRGAEAVLQMDAEEDRDALSDWALRLAQRTDDHPQDSRSWYLLGHAYLKLSRYPQAAEAFGTASALVGDDLNVKLYWLQARYLAADGIMDATTRSLAEQLLTQNPGLGVVLEMLSMDAFRQGDPEQAIVYLNRALTGANDPRQQVTLANGIAQVRASLTDPPVGVTVNISADGEVASHATVFALARPVGGGMPYAVVKQPAFLLPFAVRLDDLVSMSPERKLSDADQFEIVVRLSSSGAAMAQPGDWQWLSAPQSLMGGGSINLEANLQAP